MSGDPVNPMEYRVGSVEVFVESLNMLAVILWVRNKVVTCPLVELSSDRLARHQPGLGD
jgi:hypothetical protein